MSRISKRDDGPDGVLESASTPRLTVAVVCVLLLAMVWIVFGQTRGHEFVNYDDNEYVYENPEVSSGITPKGIAWAFTYAGIGHWHPVTWLSHMLDCQVYGLQPGWHHLTNVLLHGAAATLLFLVLRQMTGALWRGAFVAAVFAIHPLHVESVAWVAERKDVLSAVFFMLTLWAYARYAQMPPSRARYFTVIALYAIGLMCKGMLVSLPFVLLLLDYWPLNRWKPDSPHGALSGLFIEKIPLFVLSAASCVITSLSPEDPAKLPHYSPVGNAVVSCVIYLRQMFWPTRLAIPYPYPANGWPAIDVALALALLAAISILAVFFWRKHPYIIVGWLWYLGMLVPVIGIVQISYYARADRYTYLPQIGLYVLLTWVVADLSTRLPFRRLVLGSLSAITIISLMFVAGAQAAYWKDSRTLWNRALAVTTDNAIAHLNLGLVLLQNGEVDGAIAHFQNALEIMPRYPGAHNNLGNALLQKGLVDEAIAHYQEALEMNPGYAEANYNMGNALRQKGLMDEAVAYYQKALEINPGYAEASYNLGNALQQKGLMDEAAACYQKALEIKPGYAEAHLNLGIVLYQEGRLDEAIAHYQKALEFKPDYAEAQNNLGNAMLERGSVQEAVRHYQMALKIKPDYAEACNNLGSVLLKSGQIEDAIAQYEKALEIQPNFAQAHSNLGNALRQKGEIDEAVAQYQKALQIEPGHPEVEYNLGLALQQKGRIYEAIVHYQKALELKPDFTAVLNKLAYLFAACPQDSLRNGAKAVELAQRANQATRDSNPIVLGTLAAAFAESGRFSDAVGAAQRALDLANSQSNTALADHLRSQIALYKANTPFRDTSLGQ